MEKVEISEETTTLIPIYINGVHLCLKNLKFLGISIEEMVKMQRSYLEKEYAAKKR